MPEISLAIVTWNSKEHLMRCLSSIRDNVKTIGYEVVVVDNGSTDESDEMVASDYPEVRLVRNGANLGFTKGINQAIKLCEGDFVLILNDDIVVLPGAVELMLKKMKSSPDISVLACGLLNSDGTPQHFCRRFPTITTALFQNTFLQRLFPENKVLRDLYMKDWPHNDFREVDQPPGCCLMVRGDVIKKAGLFDESMFLFFSDVDWCLRVKKAGFKIFFTPEANVIHYHGVATKKISDPGLIWHKDRFYYYRKHHGLFSVAVIKLELAADFLLRTIEMLIYNLLGKTPFKETAHNVRKFYRILKS